MVADNWDERRRDDIDTADDIAQPIHFVERDVECGGGWTGAMRQSIPQLVVDEARLKYSLSFAIGPNQSRLRPETMVKITTPTIPRKRALYRRYAGSGG